MRGHLSCSNSLFIKRVNPPTGQAKQPQSLCNRVIRSFRYNGSDLLSLRPSFSVTGNSRLGKPFIKHTRPFIESVATVKPHLNALVFGKLSSRNFSRIKED